MIRTLALHATAASVLGLNGCSLAAAFLCDDRERTQSERGVDCDEARDRAREADGAVVGALRAPQVADTLLDVRVQGLVADGGAPSVGAKVRLSLDGAGLAVVSTDEGGRYRLVALVESGECEGLALAVADSEGRAGSPAAARCGEQVLDYDFATGAWSERPPPRGP